ncbi:MAG: molecular chaperone TorD family protein [Deltaproteobacteria bacterium]|jgi:TorA maturation chaperone TorD|nr:molecular chaperone TorD family protein [Deltaproteobacteria bacterium]
MTEPALPRTTRAQLYCLFSRLLTVELEEAQLAELRHQATLFGELDPELASWLEEASPATLASLRSEFARLFLLPKGVAPLASAWLIDEEEPLARQLASLTHHCMAALELEQTGRFGALSLDHLGLLYAVASEALDSQIEERFELGEHFEREALGPWIQSFARALESRSTEPLYRALARAIALTQALSPPAGARSA